jgi:hypothetical protein
LGNDDSSKDGKATWDTSAWDEGVYELRAVGTDQPSNAPREGLDVEAELATPVCVDRAPPAIEAKRKGDTIEVVVTDPLSKVSRLEVMANGKVSFSPRCEDGVCDNTRETFRFAAPKGAQSDVFSLRAVDVAGNAVESPVPAP